MPGHHFPKSGQDWVCGSHASSADITLSRDEPLKHSAGQEPAPVNQNWQSTQSYGVQTLHCPPLQPYVQLWLPPSTHVPLPLHVSALLSVEPEQPPAPHTVPAATYPFAGHAFALPLQLSATSQTPAADRQTVPAATTPSPGQDGLEPVQLSATSQTSDAARQTVPGEL